MWQHGTASRTMYRQCGNSVSRKSSVKTTRTSTMRRIVRSPWRPLDWSTLRSESRQEWSPRLPTSVSLSSCAEIHRAPRRCSVCFIPASKCCWSFWRCSSKARVIEKELLREILLAWVDPRPWETPVPGKKTLLRQSATLSSVSVALSTFTPPPTQTTSGALALSRLPTSRSAGTKGAYTACCSRMASTSSEFARSAGLVRAGDRITVSLSMRPNLHGVASVLSTSSRSTCFTNSVSTVGSAVSFLSSSSSFDVSGEGERGTKGGGSRCVSASASSSACSRTRGVFTTSISSSSRCHSADAQSDDGGATGCGADLVVAQVSP
mmetsp:Transcript_45328/g.96428  ORF Transcript_45328/g.96428 Transcript_45328/m.96428 type:complete len:322 (-) Transcript_45328:270-1235(-)